MMVFLHTWIQIRLDSKGMTDREWTNQIVEVLADLPDDSRESWPEQLLHVVGPRAVPVVRLQVVNPLTIEKGN